MSLPDASMGKHVVIFGADMSSAVYNDNKEKSILIIGKEPTQGLVETTLITEAKYPIKIYTTKQKICNKSTLKWKQQLLIC